MAEKPTAAFILSLIGAIFILLQGILIAAAGGAAASLFGEFIGGLVTVVGVVAIIFGILVLIGAVMINSGVPGKVKTGGILTLIFSILSIFTGGGFFIGFILGLVGGILALVWKPPAPPAQPQPQPAQPTQPTQ